MKVFGFFFLLSVIFFSFSFSSSYRILAVFPLQTKSHFIVIESVLKILAKRGHQVDVVSHYPRKIPIQNYTDIVSFKGLMTTHENNMTVDRAFNSFENVDDLVDYVAVKYGNEICDFMGHEKFQKLVKNPPADPPYDLVITQASGANCYMGLGYVFNVPVVAIATTPEFPWITNFIGNAENRAAFPNLYLKPADKKLTFWERLKNVYIDVRLVRKFHALTDLSQTASMKKYLRSDMPNIREVERNVALVLVNTHPIINGIKPITASLVQIAGLHVEANEEIMPSELKRWMDDSIGGVVYFTLGSMVLIESLPVKQLQEIFNVFENISPVKVLMKVANDTKLPLGLPKNVKTMRWIPQQPVLAHPNTKIFITHGGLGGTQEALYFGIPTIGLPIFSDQFGNIDSLVAKGMSIRLCLKELSKKTLTKALNEILNNSNYKKNAIYYSKLFRDNPMSQSDKAIFWIEYVIRNGGNSIKSPALQYSWIELLLLDVYSFILIIFASILILLKLLLNKVFGGRDSFKTARNKKNS